MTTVNGDDRVTQVKKTHPRIQKSLMICSFSTEKQKKQVDMYMVDRMMSKSSHFFF